MPTVSKMGRLKLTPRLSTEAPEEYFAQQFKWQEPHRRKVCQSMPSLVLERTLFPEDFLNHEPGVVHIFGRVISVALILSVSVHMSI
jgi:hypothetical protein